MDSETTPMLKNTGNGDRDEDDDDVLFIPKPGRKLEPRPPPFLTKTFDMVDDPKTNSYITWNSSGTGFIIFDHNNFSAHVLPTFFKTTNFSSFVYQLNSYGFRKISWERYEYGNQWFQAGKKHWLKNIKRRGQQSEWSQSRKKRARFAPGQDVSNVTIESKLDAIITEQNEMKRNIKMIKQNLDDMEGQIKSLEIPKLPEFEDEKTSPAFFLKQFMEYLEKKKPEASDDNSKRQRLDGSQNTEHPVDPEEKITSAQDPNVEKFAEIAESGEFWMRILEGDDAGGFDSNEGCGFLDDLDSKAMIEEMMASNVAMQNEIIIAAKPSGRNEEEDHHIQLWK